MLSDWQMSCRTHDKGHTLYHHGGLAQPTRLVFLWLGAKGKINLSHLPTLVSHSLHHCG